MLQLLIQRTCMPNHAIVARHLARHRLEADAIEHALLIILLFVLVVVLSWLPFLAMG